MPSITINGTECEFEPGRTILQVANDHGIEIPQYCYHDGLSIVASCRICLAEVWAPNPRKDGALEPLPKLMPTCQTTATDGMAVYTDSPKSIANQKSVMEYLLINHPLDCPVCDQAGECLLQDYSYDYGRGVSRFEESKVKQPKKDLGPHVYLYADRCIMCTRCVRFTREVTGTSELMVEGRGNTEQIDVFPGVALDNPLSANVIDLCPVGALLDKDFLFAQRVWFLRSTPSIDGITASGDNILIEHNEGTIYRIRPRKNMDVNKWWISDEIRYGWKFVHSDDRLCAPERKRGSSRVECDFARSYNETAQALAERADKPLLLVVSPMLPCEEAFLLARMAMQSNESATLAIGPIPVDGEDQSFPGGYTVRAEKAPNARGVRRVLEAMAAGPVESFDRAVERLGRGEFGAVILTGSYPSDWITESLAQQVERSGAFVVLIDTLVNRLRERADVVLPGATWAEKAGTFENADGRLQAFEQAIPAIQSARTEGQIALDLMQEMASGRSAGAPLYNAAEVRREMADAAGMEVFGTDGVHLPRAEVRQEADMQVVEL